MKLTEININFEYSMILCIRVHSLIPVVLSFMDINMTQMSLEILVNKGNLIVDGLRNYLTFLMDSTRFLRIVS